MGIYTRYDKMWCKPEYYSVNEKVELTNDICDDIIKVLKCMADMEHKSKHSINPNDMYNDDVKKDITPMYPKGRALDKEIKYYNKLKQKGKIKQTSSIRIASCNFDKFGNDTIQEMDKQAKNIINKLNSQISSKNKNIIHVIAERPIDMDGSYRPYTIDIVDVNDMKDMKDIIK